MSIFCRLCAETKDPSNIVTSINDPERSIERKLIACCQWNPQNTDFELPQDVCLFCYERLENSWLFLQSVQSAQRKIQNICENDSGISKPISSSTASTAKTSKSTFQCNKCENIFPSRIAMEKHECISSRDDPHFKCNICQKTFKTRGSFLMHCKNQGKLKCDMCLDLFCSYKLLEKHKEQACTHFIDSLDIVESKPTFVDCSSEIGGTGGVDIVEHEAGTSTEFDFPPIQFRFNESGDLEPPIRNSFPRDQSDREYYCYLCKRGFKKFPLLKYHMVVHTLPRRFKCQYCNSRFRTQRHYTSHQKNHIDYFCDVCSKKFPSAFALKVHRRMHMGASVKMYGCEECDHFFVDVSTYYNHMRRRHGLDTAAAKKKAKLVQPNGTAKPYVCEQCGKDFMERSSLKAHSVVHLDIRPFQCNVCPKAFKNKYNLKTHLETHSGERSVQCTECGKKYSRKSVLLKHMEEHTGVFTKTFPCDFCDRVFRSLYNMQNHRRTHTGEKPFRCEICNHDVTTKSQLDRHLKTLSHTNQLNKLNETLSFEERQDYV